MNIYQILDIRSDEVRSILRARNRRQAAAKAVQAGRRYFRVRRLFARFINPSTSPESGATASPLRKAHA